MLSQNNANTACAGNAEAFKAPAAAMHNAAHASYIAFLRHMHAEAEAKHTHAWAAK